MSQILTTSESESVPASDIMPNFSSIASNSGTIKFIILESCFRGIIVTNINVWPFATLFGIFGFRAILDLEYRGY